jgi:hypothetical protein
VRVSVSINHFFTLTGSDLMIVDVPWREQALADTCSRPEMVKGCSHLGVRDRDRCTAVRASLMDQAR